MKILAIELSTPRGSLAWVEEGKEWEWDWPNDRKNSGAFFVAMQRVSTERGWPEKIVVGLGPGSYAGTRIAISAAIGLSAASGAQLLGAPSISALKTGAEEYCAIGDARRHSFFFARIRDHRFIEGPILLSDTEMRSRLELLSEKIPVFASERLPFFQRVEVEYPSALVLARLVREESGNFSEPPLEPMYLREPHITMAKKS